LIAGPNGAGKTTFAREMIPFLHPGVPFLNADEIQLESLAFRSHSAAAKELLCRLDLAERSTASFAVETTFEQLLAQGAPLVCCRLQDGSALHRVALRRFRC
jgi:predicted ABC-type ATPase